MNPHPFRPIKSGSNRCATCGGWSDASYHSLELFTDADREREAARQAEEVQAMNARLRSTRASISHLAGNMERESPLFMGKGENPCLF